jgi:hypothetical protein
LGRSAPNDFGRLGNEEAALSVAPRGECIYALEVWKSSRSNIAERTRTSISSRRRASVPRKNGIFLKSFKKLWSWELACAGKPFVKSFERGISLWMEEDFFS